jgi:integrase
MPRLVNRLSKTSAAAIVAAGTAGDFADGLGLYLQLTERGSASWIVVYRHRGRRRKAGLGAYRLVTLEQARQKRDEMHQLLRLEGQDPLAGRAVRRQKQDSPLTFREAARRMIEASEDRRKNAKSSAQWHMTLLAELQDGSKAERDYCGAIANLPVGIIETPDILRVLQPVWKERPETASRLRGRIEAVIAFAQVHGLAGDVAPARPNPARWKGHLEHVLPGKSALREVKHLAALDYQAVPDFMSKVRIREGIAARALELTVLCATRTSDTLGMRRSDVDLEDRMWVVPRSKNGREFRIPLARQAVELLKRVFADYAVGDSDFVFQGEKAGQPLSSGSMLAVRNRLVDQGLLERGVTTVHGIARAGFKSWAGDHTAADHAVIESCLSHTINGALEKAYRRSDFYAKRARLMQSWADFVEDQAAAKVISLHG